jgi:hypothetical protein
MSRKEIPQSWQAGFIKMAQPLLKKSGADIDMTTVYKEAGVAETKTLQTARMILKNMRTEPRSVKDERLKITYLERSLSESRFQIDVLDYKIKNPDCQKEGERIWYSPEYKNFILQSKEKHDLSWEQISRILEIPIDTLKKFKRSKDKDDSGSPDPPVLPDKIKKMIGEFLKSSNSEKKSVKLFCKLHPNLLNDLDMNYRQVLHWLSRMGLSSSRGIFLNNTGLDKIERFEPHSIWGTDGKNMVIIINGVEFRWVWQCLVEYKTTVIVGGLIEEGENTANLLEAIRKSSEQSGVTPMAIVLDNRLSENLPAIKGYLDTMGIEIIKTFPGNSKSNGIVEGNFSIFEKWVGGKTVINGDTTKELSKSIAEMLVEVFTQLRNHQPKRSLNNKTSSEALSESRDLSSEEIDRIKSKLKDLADRFKNEQSKPITSERKEQAIEQAIIELQPTNKEVFIKKLSPSIYTADLILKALAILKEKRQKYPEKSFGYSYFGGILRNLADQQSIEWLCTHLEEVYSNHWESMRKSFEKDMAGKLEVNADAVFKQLCIDYFKMPIPAYGSMIILQLKTIFLLAAKSQASIASNIRKSTTELIKKMKIYDSRKRSYLMTKIFEWESIVLAYDHAAS